MDVTRDVFRVCADEHTRFAGYLRALCKVLGQALCVLICCSWDMAAAHSHCRKCT